MLFSKFGFQTRTINSIKLFIFTLFLSVKIFWPEGVHIWRKRLIIEKNWRQRKCFFFFFNSSIFSVFFTLFLSLSVSLTVSLSRLWIAVGWCQWFNSPVLCSPKKKCSLICCSSNNSYIFHEWAYVIKLHSSNERRNLSLCRASH